MKRSTFHLLFYIKRCELRRDGTAPIMGRITINGCAKQFTCCMAILPEIWDAKAAKAIGTSDEARQVNQELKDIRKDLTRHYWEVRRGVGPLTAERVKASYFREGVECKTLLQIFARHNEDMAKQVSDNFRTKSTLYKYRTAYNHLNKFLISKYRVKDIALLDLRASFITEFELFLRNKKRCSANSIWTYLMPLKRMIAIARDNGWMELNPFSTHRIISPRRTERNYLTTNELGVLIRATFTKKMHTIIKDLFLFCAFTGVTYADLAKLTKSNMRRTEDGNWWLSYKRQKTGLSCTLPLLDIPMKIIRKYRTTDDSRLFPVPCYATLRMGIKIVLKDCGINRHITWHDARHTYASEICLSNGVPIETISKMLGHADIKTTQIYAKLSNTVVERDMETLSRKLSGMSEFSPTFI